MNGETLVFALTAGTLAAVNPCGFAMLPAYLALFVTGDDRKPRSTPAAVGRAVIATASMTVGFVAVFSLFGLALTPIASTVQRWIPVATVVIGVVLVLLGLAMLAGRNLMLHVPFLRLAKDPLANPLTMALYGISYAVASLGCTIGPFLVVTATTFRTGSLLDGIAAYAAYAAGMGLVVGVLAIAAALTSQAAATALRRITSYLTRAAGALLVIAGAYVAWYGVYELRVYAGGTAEDPVIEAAGEIQNRLAAWVDALGVTTFVIALAVLAALAVTLGLLAKKARPARMAEGHQAADSVK